MAFFVGLYQAFKLLGYIGQGDAFSPRAAKALRTIKHCALTLIAFLLGVEAYIFLARHGEDDIAGGVAIGLVLIFISLVVAASAGMLEWRLKR